MKGAARLFVVALLGSIRHEGAAGVLGRAARTGLRALFRVAPHVVPRATGCARERARLRAGLVEDLAVLLLQLFTIRHVCLRCVSWLHKQGRGLFATSVTHVT